ncbi:MAG: hypothetical protein RL095_557 [Verrucomicrobiota bacterium]|jgi:hypothetical protein
MRNEIELKYPWCAGVPRPIVITNLDEEFCCVFYQTAEIVTTSQTAILRFSKCKSVKHSFINDDKNEHLKNGCFRDSIYKSSDGFLLFFHNEMIEIVASSLSESISELESSDKFFEDITSLTKTPHSS